MPLWQLKKYIKKKIKLSLFTRRHRRVDRAEQSTQQRASSEKKQTHKKNKTTTKKETDVLLLLYNQQINV